MKQLTTAQRIVIGFAIAPLALVGLVFYALHDLATLKQQSAQIVQQDWPKIAPIMVIATGVRDNGRNTRDLLIDADNQAAQASIGSTRQRITEAFATLEPLLDTAEGQAAYATLKTHRETYVAAFTQVQALIKQGAREQGLAQLKQQVMPAELAVFKSLDALMAMQGRVFAEREQAAQLLYDDARRTMLGLLLLCVALVVTAAVIVTRSVIRPLGGEPDEAARVLSHIAQGDLTIEVPLCNSAEGSVMRNLHQMQQNLNQMVRQIAASVDGVASSSEELSAVSSQTSSSLQSQGQEIEQMIGNIRQDTEHAVAAMHSSSERVQATLGVAQRSGEALDEITRSISQINERNMMIASATEEQALVAREVDRNLVGIRTLSQQVLQGALHTETAGHDLAGMAGALHQTVARFKV
ncbi:MCP four helix bundle domain-containing protein [Pseudomonas allii]|uniref:MCP four helix bundle domain-containing protein n=1 Tax=Pseudomonas allii TaxID=2740531 RepID=A0A7Y8V0D6_9PSED|nr:MCP four helix bundle domain-containing protein [Pseudomonas allii]NWN63995.1 MCP four helix bundle domain-containing protein [Pseudomonas allii]